MTQKFSLAYLTVANTPPPEMIYMAARAGYDYVSLRPINMGLPGEPDFSLAKNKPLLKETKKALQDTGLELLDIELARVIDGVNLKEYEAEFEVAAELGGRHVLSSVWTDEHDYAVAQFAELCDIAKGYNLTVDLEYVPIASVANLADTVDVLEKVDRSNAGLLIDVHHFHRAHDTIEALAQVPKEWFNFFHLCDATSVIPSDREEMIRIVREARSYVGEGGIDIASIVNTIPQVPYSIELPNKEQVDLLGHEEFARRCLQSAKAYFAEHVPDRNKSNCL